MIKSLLSAIEIFAPVINIDNYFLDFYHTHIKLLLEVEYTSLEALVIANCLFIYECMDSAMIVSCLVILVSFQLGVGSYPCARYREYCSLINENFKCCEGLVCHQFAPYSNNTIDTGFCAHSKETA